MEEEEEEEREEIWTSSLTLIWTPGAVRSSVQSPWCHSNDAAPPPVPLGCEVKSPTSPRLYHPSAGPCSSDSLHCGSNSPAIVQSGMERFCWICMLRSQKEKEKNVCLFFCSLLRSSSQVIRGLGSCSEMIPPYKKGIWEEDAHISQNRKKLIPADTQESADLLLDLLQTLKVQLLCLSLSLSGGTAIVLLSCTQIGENAAY